MTISMYQAVPVFIRTLNNLGILEKVLHMQKQKIDPSVLVNSPQICFHCQNKFLPLT